MSAAQPEITDLLRRHSPAQTESAKRPTETVTAMLDAIAGVSLLVGGIGIVDIMLMSVTEWTREIGIRLAVGACASDIVFQFLVEARDQYFWGLLTVTYHLGWSVLRFGASLGYSHRHEHGDRLIVPQCFRSDRHLFWRLSRPKAANLDPIETLRRNN